MLAIAPAGVYLRGWSLKCFSHGADGIIGLALSPDQSQRASQWLLMSQDPLILLSICSLLCLQIAKRPKRKMHPLKCKVASRCGCLAFGRHLKESPSCACRGEGLSKVSTAMPKLAAHQITEGSRSQRVDGQLHRAILHPDDLFRCWTISLHGQSRGVMPSTVSL